MRLLLLYTAPEDEALMRCIIFMVGKHSRHDFYSLPSEENISLSAGRLQVIETHSFEGAKLLLFLRLNSLNDPLAHQLMPCFSFEMRTGPSSPYAPFSFLALQA